MDLCTWYLRDVFTNVRFVTVDDASIARVQQKSFLDTLSKDDAAVSKLVQSLAGTLLHEVSGNPCWKKKKREKRKRGKRRYRQALTYLALF
jgi:hypothetical protein